MAIRAKRLSFGRRRGPKKGKRLSACKRGYDRQWRTARAAKLRRDPFCEDCIEFDDITTPAEEVHHKKKIKDFPELRLCMENLMSLCKRHHTIRSARGE